MAATPPSFHNFRLQPKNNIPKFHGLSLDIKEYFTHGLQNKTTIRGLKRKEFPSVCAIVKKKKVKSIFPSV